MSDENANVELKFLISGLKDLKSASLELDKMKKALAALAKSKGKSSASAEMDKLKTAANKAARAIKKVGQVGKSSGQLVLFSWKSVVRLFVGQAITRSLHAMLSAFRENIDEAAKFSIRIAEIQTISENAQLGFERWSSAVHQLSDDFGRSGFDVAEGIYQMLSNQIAEGEMAVLAMDQALKLSIATVSTSEQAVQALTGALNAYGAGVEEAEHYSDVFFKTVELGRIRLGELANTMGRINMPASQLGITFEESAASIATLTRQGIGVNEAMTYQRNIMLKLLKPTDKMKELFKAWGVESGEAAIATWGYVGVLGKLKTEVEKNGDSFAELAKYFSRVRAITGAGGLIGNFRLLEESLYELSNVADVTEKAMKRITDVDGFSWQQEWQEIKNFFLLDVGKPMLATILKWTDALGGLGESVQFIGGWMMWFGKIVGILGVAFVAVKIVAWTAALATTVSTLGLAAMAAQALTIKIFMLKFAIAPVTAGLTLLVAAVGYLVYKTITGFGDKFDHIKNFAQKEVDTIKRAEAEKLMEYKKTQREAMNVMEKMYRQSNMILGQAVAKQKAALQDLRRELDIQNSMADMIREYQLDIAGSPGEKLDILEQSLIPLREEWAKNIALGTQDGMTAANKIIAKMVGLTKTDIGGSGLVNDPRLGTITSEYYLQNKYTDDLMKSLGKTLQTRKAAANITEHSLNLAKEEVSINERLALHHREREKALKAVHDIQAGLTTQIGTDNTTAKSEAARMIEALRTYGDMWDIKGKMELLKVGGNILIDPEKMKPEIVAILEAVKALKALNEEYAKAPEEQNTERIEKALAWLHKHPDTLTKALPSLKSWEEQLGVLTDAAESAIRGMETTRGVNELQEVLARGALSSAQALQLHKTAILGVRDAQLDGVAAVKQSLNESIITMRKFRQDLIKLQGRANALKTTVINMPPVKQAFGGPINRFAAGGLASDIMGASVRPGEFITNPRATSEFYPQLVAMNARAARFGDGGAVTNTTVGDINVTVNGGSTSDETVRSIAAKLQREFRRGTVRLN